MTTLPNKPSELIRLALKDLQEFEKLPNCKVFMSLFIHDEDEICRACLAGATFIQEFNSRSTRTFFQLPAQEQDKIWSLDLFRMGSVREGLRKFLGYYSNFDHIIESMEVIRYRLDREKFYKDMEKIAQYLEGEGL